MNEDIDASIEPGEGTFGLTLVNGGRSIPPHAQAVGNDSGSRGYRVLILGGNGMLAKELAQHCETLMVGTVVASREEFNIVDRNAVLSFAHYSEFDAVINCAAWTNVEAAEDSENMDEVMEVNAFAPGLLAYAIKKSAPATRFFHFSTDYVFNGRSENPYFENEQVDPLNFYGASKLAGETSVTIANPNAIVFRISWLYSPLGNCFPATIIKNYDLGKTLRVIDDQVGCPTYAPEVAERVLLSINQDLPGGLYHLTGPTEMNWHTFAVQTLGAWTGRSYEELEKEIAAVPSSEYATKAKRPKHSVLSNRKIQKAGIPPMSPAHQSIQDFCARLRILQNSTT